MANRLVPYSQDEQKWTSHYMAQDMKQIKPKEMTKPLKEKMVQPSIILPTMQLVAQAESELKCQKNEAPVFEPIKATSVREKHFLNFHPISAIAPSSNVIHFLIKGHSLKYVDLQKSGLYIRCKIQDIEGGVLDEEIVFPVNHLLQSMWKQVEVFLGGKLVLEAATTIRRA